MRPERVPELLFIFAILGPIFAMLGLIFAILGPIFAILERQRMCVFVALGASARSP